MLECKSYWFPRNSHVNLGFAIERLDSYNFRLDFGFIFFFQVCSRLFLIRGLIRSNSVSISPTNNVVGDLCQCVGQNYEEGEEKDVLSQGFQVYLGKFVHPNPNWPQGQVNCPWICIGHVCMCLCYYYSNKFMPPHVGPPIGPKGQIVHQIS